MYIYNTDNNMHANKQFVKVGIGPYTKVLPKK